MTWVLYVIAYIACVIASFFLSDFVVFAIVFAALYFKDKVMSWVKWLPFVHIDGYTASPDLIKEKFECRRCNRCDCRRCQDRRDRHVSFRDDL